MPATRDDLFNRFKILGIEATTRNHPPVFTVEEAQALGRRDAVAGLETVPEPLPLPPRGETLFPALIDSPGDAVREVAPVPLPPRTALPVPAWEGDTAPLADTAGL